MPIYWGLGVFNDWPQKQRVHWANWSALRLVDAKNASDQKCKSNVDSVVGVHKVY